MVVYFGLVGFSSPSLNGEWSGLDVDICKAIAIALLSDSNKVEYVPLNAKERFVALKDGKVDILSRNSTVTLSRSSEFEINFGPVVFFDSQGFLVRNNIASVNDLRGKKVCVQKGTTSEQNLLDFSRASSLHFKTVTFSSRDKVVDSFFKKRCVAMSADISTLFSHKNSLPNTKNYKVLKKIISKEPLAPAVRRADYQLHTLLNWVVNTFIYAEELGMNSSNIHSYLNSKDPNVRRFLGVEVGNGSMLGVDEKWAYNIIKELGNYGEVFDRNLGDKSVLKLHRGLNRLWFNGGLLYSFPFK